MTIYYSLAGIRIHGANYGHKRLNISLVVFIMMETGELVAMVTNRKIPKKATP